jgi:hypothetical protein
VKTSYFPAPFSFVSFLCFLCWLILVAPARSADLLVAIRYNPGLADKPFEVRWNSVPGKRYEILVSNDLKPPWTSISPNPITATSATEVFIDQEILDHRFYIIRELPDVPESDSSNPMLTPSSASLAPNQVQRFTVSLPAGETTIWSVQTLAGGDAGNISAAGIYTAPATIPDPRFVILQAQGSKNPNLRALAILTIEPETELVISRDQAVQILLTQVIPSLPVPENALAFAVREPLDKSAELRPAKTLLAGTIEGATPGAEPPVNCWFFMVDPTPEKAWAHLVRYVFIDSRTGEVTTQIQEWYPVLNGAPLWVSVQDRKISPDLVYTGQSFKSESDRDSGNASALLRAATSPAPPKWASIFTNSPTACDCALPVRYALVIGDDSPPTDPNPLSKGANAITGFFDQDTEERMLHGGQLMAETLQAAGFQVTRLLGSANTSRKQILDELARLRALVRPCDVFVLYHTGHGNKEGVGRFIYALYARYLQWFHCATKYVIIDSCYAGNIINSLEGPNRIQAVILTSTDADNTSNVFFNSNTYDTVSKRKPLAFTNGLLLCGGSSSQVSQLYSCLLSLEGSVSDPNPRFRTLGGGLDADQDGVVDSLERLFGLDPANSDSDGDGVCDGIELAAVPLLPLGAGLVYQKPIISRDTLPAAAVLQDYNVQLTLSKPGQAFNNSSATPSNPHGFGPHNGWTLLSGALPAGMTIDRQTGRIRGQTAESGGHTFNVRYMDAIGVSTNQEFSLRVIAPANTQSPVIVVSTALDYNVRDNDISLREAIMLASGELPLSALRADPDPNDGKSEGELRWVTGGVPGSGSRDLIQMQSDFDITLLSPLIVNGDYDIYNGRIGLNVRAANSSIYIINGIGNEFDMVGNYYATGPVLDVRGSDNAFGSTRKVGATARAIFHGANAGAGALVTGDYNWLGGIRIEGFENAVRLDGTNNDLVGLRLSGNVNGVVLSAGAVGNQITSCAIGYLHENAVPEPGGNSGNGVWFQDGAHHNTVLTCGIGGNAGSGVLMTGPNSKYNQVIRGRIGSKQGAAQFEGLVGPNGRHGVAIQSGASYNRIAGVEMNDNIGDGILISGEGSAFNELGIGDTDGVTIIQTNSLGSGVRIEAGAVSNYVSVRVQQCVGDGISIDGLGTDGNNVTTRTASGIRWPTDIQHTGGAAVRISGGAQNNVLELVRVDDCAQGIVIQGSGSDQNRITSASGSRNSGPVVLLTGGCRFNRVETSEPMGENKGSGIVISGLGTGFNLVELGNFSPLVPNEKYAIEIADAASFNTIIGCAISGHKLGGIHITGENTRSNLVSHVTVNGGFTEDLIAASGSGVVIDAGAQDNDVSDSYFYSNGASGILISGADTAGNKVVASAFDGNRRPGVLIDNARDNIVGQSGNGGNSFQRAVEAAVRISGGSAFGNKLLGNIIGGSGLQTNHSHGILIESGAHGNRVGGTRPRQPKFDTIPQVFVPVQEADHAAGNLISGNAGDGIRIDGSHDNLVAGNLIGFSDSGRITPGNGGNGVTLMNGSQNNEVGDCDARPGYSNQINHNAGAGIVVAGSNSSGNCLMHNSIFDNQAGYILLQGGANHNRPIPDAEIDIVAARISGTADVNGYVELFSNFLDDRGVFHLRAFVRKGDYVIDQLHPELSKNAVIVQSPRPIRFGDQFLGFTTTAAETSEFYVSSQP